jgi:hypothetical protein
MAVSASLCLKPDGYTLRRFYLRLTRLPRSRRSCPGSKNASQGNSRLISRICRPQPFLAPNTSVTWNAPARRRTIQTDGTGPFSLGWGQSARQKSLCKREVSYMATTKVERAGVGFGISRQGGSIVLEVRTHHDTISALRGVRFSSC